MADNYFYTYHQTSGNRFVAGSGTFPDVMTHELALDNVPLWALAIPFEVATTPHQIALSVALRDGRMVGGSVAELGPDPKSPNPPGTPLRTQLNPAPAIISYEPTADESLLSSPLALTDNRRIYVARNGDLVYVNAAAMEARIALNMQPDAQIVANEAGQIAVYAEATNQRYVHAIMGDDLEGSALVVLQIMDDALEIVARVDLPGEAIYEGLAPMWADVNEDGTADLITTVSDGRNGSRIRVYLFDGQQIVGEVDGPPIGNGFRWQHQLAWGPFGPAGEMELVDVRTPHIGGSVRFYRFAGDAMQIVAERPGYTSHIISSRNLDMAVAGDFNGDGQPEIVLPSQDRTRIAGLQHLDDGVGVMWELPLDGRLSTNLSAVAAPTGLALVAGTEDARLRLWTSNG